MRRTCLWRVQIGEPHGHTEYRSHNNLDAENPFRVNQECSQAANTSNGAPLAAFVVSTLAFLRAPVPSGYRF
jgi:hypothetical protein